ncbi:M2 family metallopeptidase [Tautonia plasticadhaerens]|uniref:Angiotensin-converting enzyme n=1 Tax=Tautonia plasticadhaerens TaxID=2527974 RepID=A0A518HDX6_9BACT|nr:M2 family metallopeptidase [Tautonia plasticadhaerens]QDV39055.1 Angiotensin-converting enzyme [Tautonia plasticadhaerens]
MERITTDRRTVLRLALLAAGGGPMALARAVDAGQESAQDAANAFLSRYVEGWLPLDTASSEAAWVAMTDVSPAHTEEQVEATLTVSRFVGDPEVIRTARALLEQADALDDPTVRQLRKVLLRAAEAPGTIPDVVRERAEAEANQSAIQDGFVYQLDDPQRPEEPITPNGIDRILVESDDLDERRIAWETSKTVGVPLRDGLLRLRDLRNQVARELGYDDFFALQVADYGISVDEMIALCDGFVSTVTPLYEQLHTWAKHRLAGRYGAEAPEGLIPAHWLPNRWGQLWPGLVEGIDLDAPFASKSPEFITEQAERFYVSIGFPGLPRSFYEKSDLYPVPPGSSRKKNSHASAWHIDLEEDVRSLMSIEPDARWFNTAHHELGHIYYYIAYSRPEVPHLLRGGANRAFHEGIGDLIGLAAGQRPYLKEVGLLTPEAEAADPVTFLLDTALDGASIVFLPFSAGLMTHWERDFYAGTIPDDGLNASWWGMKAKYQGIAPPSPRPESFCDPSTKTHINDDPAQYYDYAIGTVIKFQLHDHIARDILGQDPRDCNYYGNKQVGDFLRSILEVGATRDWDTVLREATGSGLSAGAMMSYFEPLNGWLAEQNAGRKVGWS